MLDILVLIWHFYQLPILFYDCSKLVWQFVSHLLMFNLYDEFAMPNDVQCFWFFVWCILWMSWLIMNFLGIFGFIYDLFEIFISGWSFVNFWIVLNFNDLVNAGCLSYGCELLPIVSRHIEVYCGFGLRSLPFVISVLGLC